MHDNDTYGEITANELAALRASAHKCSLCGMLADVDPAFHQSRYGHAPSFYQDGARYVWRGRQQRFIAQSGE